MKKMLILATLVATMFTSCSTKTTETSMENKQIATNFVNDVLMGKAPEKLASYFDGNNYIQHNPAIANGLDGLGAALQWMAENNMVMVYDKLHLVMAEGDKVLCVSEGKFGVAPGEHVAFYDIFRIENGKIAEHWDNIQTIPADADWANPNGKFGF